MGGMVASPVAEARVVVARVVLMGVAVEGASGHGWAPKAVERVGEAWVVAMAVV